MERLQKYIAHCGVASRRKAEQLITNGKVKVNNITVTQLGTKIDSNRDIVHVNGEIIKAKEKLVYYVLNKPSGYVTTVKDQFNRPVVNQLLQEVEERVYPVGRLDYETEGLLLLTNDGELAYKLTHPKYKINKVYQVLVEGKILVETLVKLETGVMLEDGLTAPANTRILKRWDHQTLIELTIREGRNRQVRRMIAAVGHKVKHLKRVRIGFLQLADLPIGHYRKLTAAEVDKLKDY